MASARQTGYSDVPQPQPELELDELYRELILDHYKSPRHHTKLGTIWLCYNPCSCIQVIIRHEVGVPGLKRVLILLLSLLPASLILLSCGTTPSSSTQTSGVKYRAFITNSVSSGTGAAGVYIVNATKDARAAASAISGGNTPGMMVLTPNRRQTLVFSGSGTQTSDNLFSIINNASEQNAARLTLPGMTESIVVSPDSSAAYAAVPTAPVVGQSPGVVKAISLNSGTVTGEVEVPSVRYLSIDNSGSRILGFSDNSDSVAVITPSNIGIGNAVTYVCCFDHPVWAYFSPGDGTAYVVNCGAECGGTQASVQTLDLTTNTAGPAVNVQAATVALVSNSIMYLAGTPLPALSCTVQQVQTTCGELTTFDLASMSVVGSPVSINDGYHNRIALGANGQLFIGARTCSQAGCLSIYNTNTQAVVFPPAAGDVTGIQPIAKRTVVYVIQGGALGIYDTATDALQTLQIRNLIGQLIDVKTIDF